MGNRRWTKEEEEYLINHYGKIKTVELANNLNRSIDSVQNKAYKLGLSFGKYYTKDEEELLFKYSKKSNSSIAKMLGKTERSVRTARYKKCAGTVIDSNYDKLTVAEVSRIIGLAKSTITFYCKNGLMKSNKVGCYRMVKISYLHKWMQSNPDRWDATKCDKLYFMEYEWFREKREADFKNMVQKKWGSNAV